MRTIPLVAALAALSLAACSDSPPPRPRPAPAARQEAAAAAAPAEGGEKAAVESAYSYSPVGKRDPFRSYYESYEPVKEEHRIDELCGPLCTWDLHQLNLVAVVSGVAQPLAMVEDPKGVGHVVRRGTTIGKRGGKVTAIRRDRVVVTELLRNKQGQVLPVQTEMPLRGEGKKTNADDDVVDLSVADGR